MIFVRPAAEGRESMSAQRAFAATFCVIMAAATSSPCARGQTSSTAGPASAGGSGDLRQLLTETTVGPPQGVPDGDVDFSPPPRFSWTASVEFITLDRIGSVPYTLVETLPHTEDPLRTIGTEALNADDLHQGFSGGPRLGVIHHGDDDSELAGSTCPKNWRASSCRPPRTGEVPSGTPERRTISTVSKLAWMRNCWSATAFPSTAS